MSASSSSFDPSQRDELRRKFVAFAESRDPQLRDQLIEAHLGLAEYLARRFASLDAPSPGDEGDTMGAALGEDDPELVDAERRATLSPLLSRLPPREQTILHLRFFEGLTQSEIASRLGISQMHVSRLLGRSLAQLRAAGQDPDQEAVSDG